MANNCDSCLHYASPEDLGTTSVSHGWCHRWRKYYKPTYSCLCFEPCGQTEQQVEVQVEHKLGT